MNPAQRAEAPRQPRRHLWLTSMHPLVLLTWLVASTPSEAQTAAGDTATAQAAAPAPDDAPRPVSEFLLILKNGERIEGNSGSLTTNRFSGLEGGKAPRAPPERHREPLPQGRLTGGNDGAVWRGSRAGDLRHLHPERRAPPSRSLFHTAWHSPLRGSHRRRHRTGRAHRARDRRGADPVERRAPRGPGPAIRPSPVTSPVTAEPLATLEETKP